MRYHSANLRILVCLILSCTFKVFALADQTEKFVIQLNQPLYIAGETIWYHITKTDHDSHDEHSRIVYVNLHDQSGALLIQQKLMLEAGNAAGSLDIPISLEEGYYYLSCFTKWNLQFDDQQLVCVRIPIFNSYETPEFSSDALDEQIQQSPGNGLRIVLNAEQFSRREAVEAELLLTPEQAGNYTITVHALHDLNFQPELINNLKYEQLEASEKELSLAIEGNIALVGSGQALISDVLSLYRIGTNQFTSLKSKTGEISIPVTDYFGSVGFQLFNMNPYQPSIPVITINEYGKHLKGIKPKQLIRNQTVNDYLKDYALRRQINEIFTDNLVDSLQAREFKPIPLKPDKVYLMEKFQLMKTFEEFIREIVVVAELKKENDEYSIRLKNTETKQFFMEKPWFLVNGYLTRDEQSVLSIPFKDLKRIELFTKTQSILNQLDPVMVRSGMIVIYTDQENLKSEIEAKTNIFQFQGFVEKKAFPHTIQAPSEQQENPDFSYQLFWQAGMKLNSNTKFNFITSDLIGEYIIEITGVTNEGKRIIGSTTFTVNY